MALIIVILKLKVTLKSNLIMIFKCIVIANYILISFIILPH